MTVKEPLQFEITLSVIVEAESSDEAFKRVEKLVKDIKDFAVEIYQV